MNPNSDVDEDTPNESRSSGVMPYILVILLTICFITFFIPRLLNYLGIEIGSFSGVVLSRLSDTFNFTSFLILAGVSAIGPILGYFYSKKFESSVFKFFDKKWLPKENDPLYSYTIKEGEELLIVEVSDYKATTGWYILSEKLPISLFAGGAVGLITKFVFSVILSLPLVMALILSSLLSLFVSLFYFSFSHWVLEWKRTRSNKLVVFTLTYVYVYVATSIVSLFIGGPRVKVPKTGMSQVQDFTIATDPQVLKSVYKTSWLRDKYTQWLSKKRKFASFIVLSNKENGEDFFPFLENGPRLNKILEDAVKKAATISRTEIAVDDSVIRYTVGDLDSSGSRNQSVANYHRRQLKSQVYKGWYPQTYDLMRIQDPKLFDEDGVRIESSNVDESSEEFSTNVISLFKRIGFTRRSYYGYVLQREILDEEKLPYPGEAPVIPDTVIIPNPEYLLEVSKQFLINDSRKYTLVDGNDDYYWGVLTNDVKKTAYIHYSGSEKKQQWGLQIPPDVVVHYNLKEGDLLSICIDDDLHLVYVEEVNGCSDPDTVRKYPDISELPLPQSAKRSLPVEKYGNPSLRAITLLAPIGLGSNYWITAPGGSGKTWILLEIFDACLHLTKEMHNLHVIMGFVGDRVTDTSLYTSLLNKNEGSVGEVYYAPWNASADSKMDITKFIINRAYRLVSQGKNVVLLFDSISRVVSAYAASSYSSSNKASGLISGGLPRSSLEMISQYFGTHGCFTPTRSLTIIGTLLSGDTAEGVVARESSNSATTGLLTLRNSGPFPRISVLQSETYTRQPDGFDFRTEAQIKEMNHVANYTGYGGKENPFIIQDKLFEYVKNNPLPKY